MEDTPEVLKKENHGLPKIRRIDNRRQYLKTIDNARRLCYIAHNRTPWQEQYYQELTELIVSYARIH
jgi:hypothetical protein